MRGAYERDHGAQGLGQVRETRRRDVHLPDGTRAVPLMGSRGRVAWMTMRSTQSVPPLPNAA
jgi:hypothetical protein